MKIVWKGKGQKEVGVYDNKHIIKVDPCYFRPTEVETLLGDSTKAKKILGWKPKITFKNLIKEMVSEDLKLAQKEIVNKDFIDGQNTS